MDVNSISENKRRIIKKAFDEDNKVNFCGEEFDVRCIDYKNHSGVVKTKCSNLHWLDLDVIDSFNIEFLESLSKELDYLKRVVNGRMKEFKDATTELEMYKTEYKKGNKKFIRINIDKKVYLSDIYGDKGIIKREVIEEHTFSNTKPNKEIIQSKIEELESKYKLKIKNY